MKVLISSIGRRNYLAHWFRDAGALLGCELTVIGTDGDPYAPGLTAADIPVIMPTIASPEYPDVLNEVCCRYEVDLLFSVQDYDITTISQYRSLFEQSNVRVVVPPIETLTIIADKHRTFTELTATGIAVPHTQLADEEWKGCRSDDDEVVVKHRFGSGSSGVFVVDHPRLESAVALSAYSAPSGDGIVSHVPDFSRVVVQDKILGDEYGLDVVCDFDGNFQGVLARKKLRMRSGETDRAITVDPTPFIELGQRLSETIRLSGNTDVDVIMTEDGTLCVIDINTRFGGGYPFMHIAGVNLPACYLAWAAGSSLNPSWLQYEHGVIGSKYQAIMRSVTL